MVKDAARHFAALSGIRQIPDPAWRFESSMFRGFFVLEMLEQQDFDWLRDVGVDFVQGHYIESPAILGASLTGNFRKPPN